MRLEHAGNGNAVDVVAPPRLQQNELDARGQTVERHRERGRRLLPPQGVLELGVTAVDADVVSRNVRRPEKGESHDVVPMHVGHEHVVGARAIRPAHVARAETAHAASQVKDQWGGARRLHLNAR